MKALKMNETQELVILPSGKELVSYKWVFTIKDKANILIERYKARLMAKGFNQTYKVDYQETFALVAKMNTIRIYLRTEKIIGTDRLQDELYVLDGNLDIDLDQALLNTNKDVTKEIIQWHKRLKILSFFVLE